MTHSQVLERRDFEGKNVILYGKNWTNIIAPYNITDLKNFILQLNLDTYTDEDCKKFCSDSVYRPYSVMNDSF